MRKIPLTIIIFSLLFSTLFGQNSSIKLLLKKLDSASGIHRIEILDQLAEAYLQHDNAKASIYAQKALKDIKKNKNVVKPELEARLYNTLGAAYFYEKSYKKSLKYYEKEFEIISKTASKKETALAYYNMAVLSQKIKKYKKGANYLDEGLKIAKELHSVDLQLHFYKAQYILYSERGKADLALQSLASYTAIKDKQFKQTKNTASVLRRKYQKEKILRETTNEELANSESVRKELVRDTTEKGRQLEILRLEKEYIEKINAQQAALNTATAELKDLQMKRQKTQITYISIIGILILTAAVWLLMMYRQKKRAHSQLELQAELLENANALLSEKNTQIIDSINYARRIQDSILVPESEIKKYLPETFIFYQPKDIVSGDFYWFSKVEDELILAAIDCTGHGVPGAFMSIIGYTLLNEIVNEKKITKPDKVLKHLHLGVMAALQKAGSDSSADDGMDMSLCTINPRLKRFQFAGAKNHLYVMQGDKLKVLKANHHTVGGRPLRDDITVEFTSYDFMYDEKTSIYMMSDGYMDQFGGERDTKFNSKRFKKMLIDNRNLPMHEQKEVIQKTLKEWQGDKAQVDDILVVGVKLD